MTPKYKQDLDRDNALFCFKMNAYKDMGLFVDEIVLDKRTQLAGIDLRAHFIGDFDTADKQMLIDEKCATSKSCMERELKTYSLELEFTDKYGNRLNGWMNTQKDNTHYAFFFPRGTVENGKIESVSEIACFIVPRQGILDYYGDKGFTMGELLNIYHSLSDEQKKINYTHCSKSVYISHKDENGYFHTSSCPPDGQKNNYIKIVESCGLREKPINVLLPRETIKELSIASSHHTYNRSESDVMLCSAYHLHNEGPSMNVGDVSKTEICI